MAYLSLRFDLGNPAAVVGGLMVGTGGARAAA
jgi:hypothetical protein